MDRGRGTLIPDDVLAFASGFALHDDICGSAEHDGRKIASPIPAVGFTRQPFLDFRRAHQRLEQRLARKKMGLVIAVNFGVQPYKPHQQRRSGTSMTEDEELLAREELFDLRHLFGSYHRDLVALILFWIAFEQDAGSAFNSREHVYEVSRSSLPIQHHQPSETDQDPGDIHPIQSIFEIGVYEMNFIEVRSLLHRWLPEPFFGFQKGIKAGRFVHWK